MPKRPRPQGFALQNDLEMLGISHPRIVDPQILEKKAIEDMYGRLVWKVSGLREMCKSLLEKDVQQSQFGHDYLEDAFAPRELAIWWLLPGSQNQRYDRVTRRGLDSSIFGRRDWNRDEDPAGVESGTL